MKSVAVITGTTHGIGVVTALELVRADRRVVMLCNAGISSLHNRRTRAGLDLNFAVNHLGHFLLTQL